MMATALIPLALTLFGTMAVATEAIRVSVPGTGRVESWVGDHFEGLVRTTFLGFGIAFLLHAIRVRTELLRTREMERACGELLHHLDQRRRQSPNESFR